MKTSWTSAARGTSGWSRPAFTPTWGRSGYAFGQRNGNGSNFKPKFTEGKTVFGKPTFGIKKNAWSGLKKAIPEKKEENVPIPVKKEEPPEPPADFNDEFCCAVPYHSD